MPASRPNFRILVLAAILMGLAAPALAMGHSPRCSLKDIEKIQRKSDLEGTTVNVSLSVEAPGLPEAPKSYKVPYGYTAAKILEIDYNVGHGVVCCHPNDVKSVNGLDTDFAARKYWMLSINGSHDVSPNNTVLNDGDKVVWTYSSDKK